MGFFGSLFKAAVAFAVNPLAGAAYVGYKIANTLSENKQAKQTERQVSQTISYSDAHSAGQVSHIAGLVREYYNIYRVDGENAEAACKQYVNDYFDALISKLQTNEQLAESFGIEQIQRKKTRLCNEIDGAITDALRLKLSIDNCECRQILEMDAGSAKADRMREFVSRTIRDAKNELADTVSKTANQLSEDISKFLQDYTNSQEQNVERKMKQFEQWEHDMETENFDRERAQLPALTTIYAIEQIEKILAA